MKLLRSDSGTFLQRLVTVVGLGFASLAAADTVALKSFVRVPPGAAVRLADVADLSGSEAEGLGSVVVLASAPAPGAAASVDLAQIRRVLEGQPKLNMGRLKISGTSCSVRGAAIEAPAPTASPKPSPVATEPGETVRDRVVARIASAVGADVEDLKLSFEDQAELLNTSAAGRTVAVQAAAMGERMPLTVRVFDGDKLLNQATVRVAVQVRRDVLVAKTPFTRGMLVNAESVEAQQQWLSPNVSPATRDQVIGALARGRIDVGKVVQQRDVEPPVIVKRGDLITVDCIAGTVVVGTTARAKEPGRDGQVIDLQSLSSKKTFQARINGPGHAVLVAPGDAAADSEQKP